MNNYPPGVTGNEPEIAGAPECSNCGGIDFEEYEEDIEGADGRLHRATVWVCADCGKVMK